MLFHCRACIAIGILFLLSASGIFIRAIRSLVVEKHAVKVSAFAMCHLSARLMRQKGKLIDSEIVLDEKTNLS